MNGSEDSHNISPGKIANHGHSISRTKIYPTYTTVSSQKEVIAQDCMTSSALPQQTYQFSISEEDSQRYRHIKMICIELYHRTNTCLDCDKSIAKSVITSLERCPVLWHPGYSYIRHLRPFYRPPFHLQIFKVLPKTLETCRVLGQRIHCPEEDRHRQGLMITSEHTVSHLFRNILRSVRIEFEEGRKGLGSDLVVKLPDGVFEWCTSPEKDPPPYIWPRSDLNRIFDSINVFFYITCDTLREFYYFCEDFDSETKLVRSAVSSPSDLMRNLREVLILKTTELDELERAKKCKKAIPMKLKSLFSSNKSSPKKRPMELFRSLQEAYSTNRGQEIMRNVVKYVADQLYSPIVDYGSPRIRRLSVTSDEGPTTSFIFLGRFLIGNHSEKE